MTHQRQKIREKVAEILAPITAPTPIYETRIVPWREASLPGIAVYTLDESSVVEVDTPRRYERTLTLEIVAAVQAGANVDDALDSIADQIETLMGQDPWLDDTCSDSILVASEMAVDEGGNKPIGLIRLNYTIMYYTNVGILPEDDFGSVDAKWSVNNAQPDARDQAEDTFDVDTE